MYEDGNFRSGRERVRNKQKSDQYWRDLSASPPKLSEEHRARENEIERLHDSTLSTMWEGKHLAFTLMTTDSKRSITNAFKGTGFKLTIERKTWNRHTNSLCVELNEKETKIDHGNAKKKAAALLENTVEIYLPTCCRVEATRLDGSNIVILHALTYEELPRREEKQFVTGAAKKELRNVVKEAVEEKVTSESWTKISWRDGKSLEPEVKYLGEEEYNQLIDNYKPKRKKGEK